MTMAVITLIIVDCLDSFNFMKLVNLTNKSPLMFLKTHISASLRFLYDNCLLPHFSTFGPVGLGGLRKVGNNSDIEGRFTAHICSNKIIKLRNQICPVFMVLYFQPESQTYIYMGLQLYSGFSIQSTF